MADDEEALSAEQVIEGGLLWTWDYTQVCWRVGEWRLYFSDKWLLESPQGLRITLQARERWEAMEEAALLM